MTAQNMPVPDGVKFLYKHLIDSKQIVDIQGYHAENLHIYSKQVLNMIEHDEEGWEDMVPEKVVLLLSAPSVIWLLPSVTVPAPASEPTWSDVGTRRS